MKGAWQTYALMINGEVIAAPGCAKSPDEIGSLRVLGRVETRQAKDGRTTVFQYREISR